MTIDCPCCQVPLREVKLGDLVLDECELCDGLWFDDGEPERLVTLASLPKNALQPLAFDDSRKTVPPGARKCPRCQVVMRVWEWRATSVDVCGECRGMWLDRWELQKILAD